MLSVFSLTELVTTARRGERKLLDRLDAVCSEVGAFGLIDTGLDNCLVERVHADTLNLFKLPAEAKSRLVSSDGDQFVGWKGQSDNRNEFGFPDHKEMFHIGPRVDPTLRGPDRSGVLPAPGDPSTDQLCELWPDELPSIAESWHAYYRAMQNVASQIGEVMAASLGLPAQRWRNLIADNWSDLAANYYPPADSAEAEPTGVRNALHSDLTLFTILFQDSGGGGGLHMRTREGVWLDVPPVDGQYLVNVGELLTYLTSGRWWAVPHEVKPTEPSTPGSDTVRLSIPFFHRPNDGQEITPFSTLETSSPLQVGEWVRERKLLAKGA